MANGNVKAIEEHASEIIEEAKELAGRVEELESLLRAIFPEPQVLHDFTDDTILKKRVAFNMNWEVW